MSSMTIAVNLVASSIGAEKVAAMAAKLNKLGAVAGGLSGKFTNAKGAMVGLGLAAAGMDVTFGALLHTVETGISDAGDLEMAITRLQLASGLTGDAFENLKLAVVDMATHSLYSATDASGAFEKLTEMGFSASQVMYGMGAAEDAVTAKSYDSTQALQGVGRQAMAVGEAMRTDAVTGATLLGSALHTFQHDSLTAADAANILVGTFYSGVPSAEAIQQAINNAGAMADSAGIKFQDFATTLGLLAQAGLPAEQAGTSLRYMIQSLIAPTNKQADALAYLGIRVTNTTSGLKDLLGAMEKQGGAAAKAAQAYDGSVTSLQKVYTAAKNAGLVPLDGTFNQWAEGIGALNSKLFDSKGNFLGLQNAIDVLDKAMAGKHLSMQQKLDIIANLFNVRSGRAAQILTNIDQFDAAYKKEWDKIGKTDALSNAQRVLGTFQGSIGELKTSITSALSEAFMPLIKAFTPFIQRVNDLIGGFLRLNPQAQSLVGWGLLLLTILTGLGGILLSLATVIGIVLTVGTPLLIALGVGVGLFLQIGAVIGVVVGWFIALKKTMDENKVAQKNINNALDNVKKALQDLKPHWDHLMQTIQKHKPELDKLGQLLGTIAVVLGVVLIDGVATLINFIGWLLDRVSDGIDLFFAWKKKMQDIGVAIRQFFQGIPGHVTEFVTTVKSKFDDLKTAVGQKIEDFKTTIKQKIQEGMDWVKQKIEDAINSVVSKFEWLYNHNYYFQDLVDFIRKKWNELVQKFNDLKAKISEIWTDLTGFLKQKATEVWNWITSKFDDGKKQVTGKATDLKNQVTSKFTDLVNAAKEKWNELATNIQNAVNNAKQWVIDKFTDLKNQAMNVWNGWPSQIYKFGQNAIQNLIDGINSKIGDLKKKLSEVASNFAKLLGFHSPPPEGPAADSDTWMPNMVDMFTSGIDRKLPSIKQAATNIATNLVLTPQSIANRSSLPASSQSGQVVIPINLDGKQVAAYVVDLGTRRVRQSGSSRYAR